MALQPYICLASIFLHLHYALGETESVVTNVCEGSRAQLQWVLETNNLLKFLSVEKAPNGTALVTVNVNKNSITYDPEYEGKVNIIYTEFNTTNESNFLYNVTMTITNVLPVDSGIYILRGVNVATQTQDRILTVKPSVASLGKPIMSWIKSGEVMCTIPNNKTDISLTMTLTRQGKIIKQTTNGKIEEARGGDTLKCCPVCATADENCTTIIHKEDCVCPVTCTSEMCFLFIVLLLALSGVSYFIMKRKRIVMEYWKKKGKIMLLAIAAVSGIVVVFVYALSDRQSYKTYKDAECICTCEKAIFYVGLVGIIPVVAVLLFFWCCTSKPSDDESKQTEKAFLRHRKSIC